MSALRCSRWAHRSRSLVQSGQIAVVLELARQIAVGAQGLLKARAFAHHHLRRDRVVPEIGGLGAGVQFVETVLRGIGVKDASSAAPATARSRR